MIDFGKAFDTMTIDEKRSALRLFVNKVVWDGENVDIYLFGADNEEPLGRGCKRNTYDVPQPQKEPKRRVAE